MTKERFDANVCDRHSFHSRHMSRLQSVGIRTVGIYSSASLLYIVTLDMTKHSTMNTAIVVSGRTPSIIIRWLSIWSGWLFEFVVFGFRNKSRTSCWWSTKLVAHNSMCGRCEDDKRLEFRTVAAISGWCAIGLETVIKWW